MGRQEGMFWVDGNGTGDMGRNTFLLSDRDTEDQYMSLYANYFPILQRAMEVKEQLLSSSEVTRSG